MSTRKASVAQPEPPVAAPDVVQQLLAERRELKVANERLRLEIDEASAAQVRMQGKPDRRLALLEEESGNITAALADLKQAEARDSEDWRLPLIEARLLTKRGDGAAAHSAFERAQSLSPLPLVSIVRSASQG